MFYKTLTMVALVIVMLASGCSTFRKVVFHPNLNQGNYLTSTDVRKIKNGMTQQQVTNILGAPILQDPFKTQTWFYICRQQTGNKGITQQTLILTFNQSRILININHQSQIIKSFS